MVSGVRASVSVRVTLVITGHQLIGHRISTPINCYVYSV